VLQSKGLENNLNTPQGKEIQNMVMKTDLAIAKKVIQE
jgi:hypothetical protein